MRYPFAVDNVLRTMIWVFAVVMILSAAFMLYIVPNAVENVGVWIGIVSISLSVVAMSRLTKGYAVLGGTSLTASMSWIGRTTVAYSVISDVKAGRLPTFHKSFGTRVYPGGVVKLNSSMDVVQIDCREQFRVVVMGLIPVRAKRLIISPKRPESFVAALRGYAGLE